MADISFIRRMQSELCIDNVPMLVQYLCLMYYHHGEYLQVWDNQMQISKDRMTVRRDTPTSLIDSDVFDFQGVTSQTAIGQTRVNANEDVLVKWVLKINDIGTHTPQ
eukprot:1055804_1